MSVFDNCNYSANLVMKYRNVNLTIEEFKAMEGKLNNKSRKYLVGNICEREKNNRDLQERIIDFYTRMGYLFGYAGLSIKNLIGYSRAINRLYELTPDVVLDILADRTRLSYRDAVPLSKMDVIDITVIMERLQHEKTPFLTILNEQRALKIPKKKPGRPKQITLLPDVTVKNTPLFDPDSQVIALVYTIPSWVITIDKAFNNTDFCEISQSAHESLIKELKNLKEITDTMILLLSERE